MSLFHLSIFWGGGSGGGKEKKIKLSPNRTPARTRTRGNKSPRKVEKVENRLLLFPTDILHTGIIQTDAKVGILLNFNFFHKHNGEHNE